MKRSEINKILAETKLFVKNIGFKLPDFAYWSVEEWEKAGSDFDEIRENMLGWDITDYGQGKFKEIGLVLFTLRNGNLSSDKYKKSYAEKILILEEGQICPTHFHKNKMEDIINRGGGNLQIKLWNSNDEGKPLTTPVTFSSDGQIKTADCGTPIIITPGNSITLIPGIYHEFSALNSKVLLGEVSSVNDDNHDNFFLEKQGRFPQIEEDEVPLHYLCNEYPR